MPCLRQIMPPREHAISSGATAAGWALRCRKRLVHDPADGPRAASAFGAASEAAIDFARAPCAVFGRDRSDLVIRNDVARTHDHGRRSQADLAVARLGAL